MRGLADLDPVCEQGVEVRTVIRLDSFQDVSLSSLFIEAAFKK